MRCLAELGVGDIVLDMRLMGSRDEIWHGVTEAAKLGARGITIHALAGPAAIKLAIEAAEASKKLTMRVKRPRVMVSLLPITLSDAELVDDLQFRVRRKGHVQQTARQVLETGADGIIIEYDDVSYVRRVSRKIPTLVFTQRGALNYTEVLHEEDKKLAGVTEVLQAHASHVLFDAEFVRRTDVEWAADMITKEVNSATEGECNGKLRSDLSGMPLCHTQ
jgi:hypothetical protein